MLGVFLLFSFFLGGGSNAISLKNLFEVTIKCVREREISTFYWNEEEEVGSTCWGPMAFLLGTAKALTSESSSDRVSEGRGKLRNEAVSSGNLRGKGSNTGEMLSLTSPGFGSQRSRSFFGPNPSSQLPCFLPGPLFIPLPWGLLNIK